MLKNLRQTILHERIGFYVVMLITFFVFFVGTINVFAVYTEQWVGEIPEVSGYQYYIHYYDISDLSYPNKVFYFNVAPTYQYILQGGYYKSKLRWATLTNLKIYRVVENGVLQYQNTYSSGTEWTIFMSLVQHNIDFIKRLNFDLYNYGTQDIIKANNAIVPSFSADITTSFPLDGDIVSNDFVWFNCNVDLLDKPNDFDETKLKFTAIGGVFSSYDEEQLAWSWNNTNQIYLTFPKHLKDGENIIFINCYYGDEEELIGTKTITIDNDNAFIKFIIPRQTNVNPFIDNSKIFTFSGIYSVPASGGDFTDLTCEITGGTDINVTVFTGTVKDNFIKGEFAFNLIPVVGEVQVKLKIFNNVQLPASSWESTALIQRLEGFIDNDGDGLDDRTGRSDANKDDFTPDEFKGNKTITELMEKRMSTATFKQSFDRFLQLDTSKGEAPVININLNSIYSAATARFGGGSSPFTAGETTFIDFGMLEEYQFAGGSVIDYFRLIIAMGFIWTTFFYCYNKIFPKDVMGS